jgi:hypothetical protein
MVEGVGQMKRSAFYLSSKQFLSGMLAVLMIAGPFGTKTYAANTADFVGPDYEIRSDNHVFIISNDDSGFSGDITLRKVNGAEVFIGNNGAAVTGTLSATGTISTSGAVSSNTLNTGAALLGSTTVSGALNMTGNTISNVSTLSATSTISTTGALTSNTLNTASLATLNSATVTNNATVGGALGVTGSTNLATLSTSGLATLNSASIANNATVGGTLGVTGNTNLATLSTSGLATLNSANIANNATVGGALGVTGNTNLSTLSTSGLAALNSASIANNATVGGALGVTGNTNLSTLSTSGLATLNSASIANNAIVGGTLGVSGNTTLDGSTTINNDLNVDSNGAVAGGNTLAVNAAGVSMAGGANSLTVNATGTNILGNTNINGNLLVSGTITGTNTNAASGILIGNNGLTIDGPTNTVSLTADNNAIAIDGRSRLSLAPTETSLMVWNSTTGSAHGLVIGQNSTVLSGGTTSTSLTLDDNGATFTNTATGGPARITGVADGTSRYDAVNVGQLNRKLDSLGRKAYSGTASVAALSGVPAPIEGKMMSVGMGYGNYNGENAVAIGAKANIQKMIGVTAGVGISNGQTTTALGVGYSW